MQRRFFSSALVSQSFITVAHSRLRVREPWLQPSFAQALGLGFSALLEEVILTQAPEHNGLSAPTVRLSQRNPTQAGMGCTLGIPELGRQSWKDQDEMHQKTLTQKTSESQTWWHVTLIPALGRHREAQRQAGLCELKVSLTHQVLSQLGLRKDTISKTKNKRTTQMKRN